MHVLWLVPDYHSFLREELAVVATLVDRCSVISQAPAMRLPGVTSLTIASDARSLNRVIARAAEVARTALCGSWPMARSDLPKIRRLSRHNEVVRRYVQKERVDVVHSHFAVPEGTAGWQAASRCPVVLTLRGVDILEVPEVGYGFMRDRFYARNIRQAVTKVAKVTVASTQTYQAALRTGVDVERLCLVPNGVDLSRFSVQMEAGIAFRKKYRIGERPLIAAAGNLVPGKAFDHLVRAIRRVVDACQDVMLVIAGEGPERAALEMSIKDSGLSANVLLPGALTREQMVSLLSAATAFAHSSLSEGFGNVILEAMAMNCAVVATRTGAAADLIHDGVNGRLVPVGDTCALADALIQVLHDGPRREAYARSAHDLVTTTYSLEARAKSFVRVYQELGGGG